MLLGEAKLGLASRKPAFPSFQKSEFSSWLLNEAIAGWRNKKQKKKVIRLLHTGL
jgi:hypothetical protein